jgi:hypothetical protein
MLRDESCRKCGMTDRYVKGDFSYCRPCHNESQKRYLERKAKGEVIERMSPPHSSLEQLLSIRKSPERDKQRCSKGHPFSGDNLRLSSQRNGRHFKRRCRACERNYKRVKYGLQPEPAPTSLTELLDN